MRRLSSNALGFTLIELMVTITIAAILMAIAVPSFQTYRATQQVRSTAAELLTAFNFARSEAIKRNTASVVVRPIGTWASGWRVQEGFTVLREFAAPAGVTVTPSSAAWVGFSNEGRLTGSPIRFTVAPQGTTAVTARCVRLSRGGKPTNRTGACP